MTPDAIVVQVTKLTWDRNRVKDSKIAGSFIGSFEADIRVIVDGTDLHRLARVESEFLHIESWLAKLDALRSALKGNQRARYELTGAPLGPLAIRFHRKDTK